MRCKATLRAIQIASPAILLTLFAILTLPVVAQPQFFCTTNGGKITIKGYRGFTDISKRKPRGEVLVIPDTINGLPVVGIGDYAFHSKYDLASITIPNSVTSIGSSAFSACASLTNITIPNSVTSIGFGAFSGCRDLTNITIPQSVTNIDDVAFSHCINLAAITVDALNPAYSSLGGVLMSRDHTLLVCPGGKTGSYTVPHGVTAIGDTAFDSPHLTSITIPNSVTNIQWHAFKSCTALINITIGSGVTTIGDDDSSWIPFSGCSKLTTITVDALNPVFSSVEGVLINKRHAALIKCPEGKTGSYTVPAGIAKIENHAFSGSGLLTSVIMPDSITNIENEAFAGCSELVSVTLGSGVKNIGDSSFSSCTKLTSITIPNSVTKIGDGAFYACGSLTNVVIGKNVTNIGKAAFASCSSSLAITVAAQNPVYGSQNGALFDKRRAKLNPPIVLIKEPANGASIDAMWVDVHGTVTAKDLKQLTIGNTAAGGMQIPARVSGNTFEARNIFLGPGTNTIVAVVEDTAENTGTNTIIIMGSTNAISDQTLPVQIQLSPSGGFAPLTVTFNVQARVPGKIQKVSYDFNGDNIPDQVKSDLQPVTYTYKERGEYFLVITVQTTVGRFSSLSGMLAMYASMFGGSVSSSVNVQSPPVLLSTIKITDPVDLKWTGTSNLYVLSGSTAAITEFDANGKIVRSKKGIGKNPSGLDVDAAGNVYVTLTGDHQVWKFKPTAESFEADTTFGNGGFIGNKDGTAGTNFNQFNAPFAVAISGDSQTITVSDSGNHRLQQFAVNETLNSSSRMESSLQRQLKSPKGLAQDETGLYLFVADSTDNRIVLVDPDIGFMSGRASGTNGSALGHFNEPAHLSANKRALYVADTGNNRVQVFAHVEGGHGRSPVPFRPRLALSSELALNHPKSIAAVNDLLEEKLYIADTGNNRVILVMLPSDNPERVWNDMKARLKAGDVPGAIAHFSITSKDKYQEAFLSLSKAELLSAVEGLATIKPATIENDRAQYYFESVIEGQKITFPIEFVKELGQWKIMEY